MTPFLLRVYNALDFVGKTEKDIRASVYPHPIIGQQVGAARHAHIVQALNKLKDKGLANYHVVTYPRSFTRREQQTILLWRRRNALGNSDQA